MDFFGRVRAQLSSLHEELVSAFIRPPRSAYTSDQLGPKQFFLDGHRFHRNDFELFNEEGLILQCSHFISCQRNGTPDSTRRPCVIYLHGNCSSRVEGITSGARELLLPRGISVCCFDFAGSGLSGGDFVTLGYKEKRDLRTVVEHLKQLECVSDIALWGRSMGAVTALRYAVQDPSIAALVIDSPFASIKRLVDELKQSYAGVWAPTGLVMWSIKGAIKERTGLDLDKLRPIDQAYEPTMPALFIAAANDNFINPKHAADIHDIYAGEKELRIIEGDHNSARPPVLLDYIADFFVAVFRPQIPGEASVFGRVALLQSQREKGRRNSFEMRRRHLATSSSYSTDDSLSQEYNSAQ